MSDLTPISSTNQVTVGTSVGQIIAAGSRPSQGILLKAMSTNTATIFIGKSNTVTTSNGYELSAGESLFLPLTNVADLYAISGTAAQKVCYLVL